MLKKLNHKNQGFTLIELMVVIVILGILAMWVAPKIMSRPEEAKQVKARLDIQNLETALKLYKLDNGPYPSTEQGLQALVEMPETGTIPKKWKKAVILKKEGSLKIPGAMTLFICPPASRAILISFPMERTVCPAAKMKIKI